MATEISARTTMIVGVNVRVVLDPEEYDWHIDLLPGHEGAEVATAVGVINALGMEIYDDEECEPDVLDDGTIRLWMSPKDPVDV